METRALLRKALPYLLALFAAALALRLYLLRRQDAAAPGGPFIGTKAPGFTLSDLSGHVVTLAGYRGRPVLVNFWATWCPGCQQEMPDLEALYEKDRKDGVGLLALSVDDSRQPVLPFVARMNPTFPILMCDPNTAKAYDIFGLPTTFLVDQDGVIVKKYVGGIDPAQAQNDILHLLKRRPS